MIYIKKEIIATFGSDFAIEKAEEKLTKEGYKYERLPPLKLKIYFKNKKDIEKISNIIKESLGYVEPIEYTLGNYIKKGIFYIFKIIFLPSKKKKK